MSDLSTDADCTEAGYNGYCEDYPCCGHTPSDPCARQEYDEPGYYLNNRHALCDHENGDCELDYEDYE